ncbi:hypothetical protein PG985_012156 [Apiospora marii]|uniref:Major facilitator superfamily (MFS) profile domain-containing protein n=1 Tax=Apiospora marii TaxID=335849 RepID=A0ABR1RE60_9PEZI
MKKSGDGPETKDCVCVEDDRCDPERMDQGNPTNTTNTLPSPREWFFSRKCAATFILSAFAFLQPLAETGIAPARDQISRDLHIRHDYQWTLVNSLILAGLGLSSIVLAPLSEVLGRKPVLLGGCLFFTVWNTACGGAGTLAQMLVLRLFSGFGASVGDSVAGGVISDLWPAERRGRAFAVFMIAPLLGTALDPICGAFLTEGADWRWLFWMTSFASVATIAVAFFFFQETLEDVVQRKSLQDGMEEKLDGKSKQKFQATVTNLLTVLGPNLQRLFRMMGTQTIIQVIGAYMALLYGILWLFLFIYPQIWKEQYEQEIRTASLNYLSFALGLVAGVNIAGHLSDCIYARLKARNHGFGRPEFRIPTMLIGTILAPAGLLCWGWSGEAKLHWIVPNIGSFVFAVGTYVSSACVLVYIIDTYTKYAASATSTNLILRSLTAAVFPLFAPYMFNSFGFGIGATILAAGFLVIGVAAMCILWFFGEKLRPRSSYRAAIVDEGST